MFVPSLTSKYTAQIENERRNTLKCQIDRSYMTQDDEMFIQITTGFKEKKQTLKCL